MSNFSALNKEEEKKKTLIIGGVFILLIAALLPFLPDNVPSAPFTIAYIVIARLVAEKYQMTKVAIDKSDQHDFHSNWRVFGVGLLCLAGSVAILAINRVRVIDFWFPRAQGP